MAPTTRANSAVAHRMAVSVWHPAMPPGCLAWFGATAPEEHESKWRTEFDNRIVGYSSEPAS